jgi:hypothetical protein
LAVHQRNAQRQPGETPRYRPPIVDHALGDEASLAIAMAGLVTVWPWPVTTTPCGRRPLRGIAAIENKLRLLGEPDLIK